MKVRTTLVFFCHICFHLIRLVLELTDTYVLSFTCVNTAESLFRFRSAVLSFPFSLSLKKKVIHFFIYMHFFKLTFHCFRRTKLQRRFAKIKKKKFRLLTGSVWSGLRPPLLVGPNLPNQIPAGFGWVGSPSLGSDFTPAENVAGPIASDYLLMGEVCTTREATFKQIYVELISLLAPSVPIPQSTVSWTSHMPSYAKCATVS